MSKLAIGTVQFGLPYGISNKVGQIPRTEVSRILKHAWASDIDMLDTAFAYGESERVLGACLEADHLPFRIVSKYPPNVLEKPTVVIRKSLEALRRSSVYGYLFHSFETYSKAPELYRDFEDLKRNGIVEKIGFSLYFPNEAWKLLEHGMDFDIVQVPYSIFDRRFEAVFSALKRKGVEIHVRSVFLQGLVFKAADELTGEFLKIRESIRTLNALAAEAGIGVSELCLGFVHLHPDIDKIVIGVESVENLTENINACVREDSIKMVKERLETLACDDEKIILPFNWK